MTKIFISYRRQDTKRAADRIFERLTDKFGPGCVFMDINRSPFGVDFRDCWDEAVSQASIVLVLIGHGWLKDQVGRRRLHSPDDFVRIEIESALRRNIPLGVVLIDGAPMPRAEQLPESLRPLIRRHAARVDAGPDFHAHMDRLIASLEGHFIGQAGGPGASAEQNQSEEARRRAEGRIEIDAAIVSNTQGRWFFPGAGKTEWFKDLSIGPEMVVAPAGSFIMGSPAHEPERESWLEGSESPQRRVTIAKPFAVGRFAVTRGEFAAFIAETGHDMGGGAWIWNGKDWSEDPGKSWSDPGFAQDDSHPVVCVSWDDAKAYIDWLNGKVPGEPYRLLSEAEWGYVCRARTETPFWWGSSITPELANYDGDYAYAGGGKKGECARKTVPVRSFQPNPWGLHQVHGNVWEWCEDCWNDNYDGAPTDGSAWTAGNCAQRVLRGGSWAAVPRYLRAAHRCRDNAERRYFDIGFRVARTLDT